MKIRTVLLSAALVVLGSLTAVVPASADGISTYYLTFRTGNLSNADTDDAVRVTMFGTEGQSAPMQFDRDFHRGETWTFGPYRHPSFGTIGYISLGKSGRESDAWYAEYVDIHEEATGRVYHCAVNEWFPQESLTRFYACV
ncbi:PLAT/LH2 domain-containing protein [Lentzea sp. NPDC092896]|uniref:PLAT/LH2 domain-containing protein n=1 Tax=Lentzea sp. NPDC092896 TaxID=3364127 RepID=UPI0037F1DA53